MMMKNTASISVKDKHKVFISSSILNRDADFLRKEVIINHLVVLKNAKFQNEILSGHASQSNFFLSAGYPSRC